MSVVIKDNALIEKLNQLNKSIEIIGGSHLLDNEENNSDRIINLILNQALNGEEIGVNIQDKFYTFNDLLSIKTDYEKYFLKNKLKNINSIIYKIKKYDTSLDSLIRKYKKTRFLEEYNEIFSTIKTRYRRDINLIVLNQIDKEIIENLYAEEEDKYYGEYLSQKRKQIIDSVISKLGIV